MLETSKPSDEAKPPLELVWDEGPIPMGEPIRVIKFVFDPPLHIDHGPVQPE